MLTLLKLNKLDPRLLIPYVDAVVEGLRVAMDANVCRRLQMLLKGVWMKLNTMIPRRYKSISQPFNKFYFIPPTIVYYHRVPYTIYNLMSLYITICHLLSLCTTHHL